MYKLNLINPIHIKMNFELNQKQQIYYDNLVQLFESGTIKCIGVNSGAGCGKTSVTIKAVSDTRSKVVFITPTHKSAHVINENLTDWNYACKVITMDSLFGWTQEYDEYGKRSFTYSGLNASLIAGVNILVFDEISMYNHIHASLFKHYILDKYTCVLLGDDHQLPPIEDKHCIPVLPKHIEILSQKTKSLMFDFASEQFTLDINERTKNMNLFKFINTVRELVYSPSHIQIQNSIELNKSLLDKYKQSQFIIVTYRIKNYQYYNQQIRNYYFGTDTEFVAGEQLICTKTQYGFISDNPILIHNSNMYTITDVQMEKTPDHFSPKFNVYKITLDNNLVIYQTVKQDLDKLALFKKNQLTIINDMPCKTKLEKTLKRKLFKEYYENVLSRVECYFQPFYAMNIHKLQGSGFDNVFILYNDFNVFFKNNVLDRNRQLYTAISRGKKSVQLLNNIPPWETVEKKNPLFNPELI